jgi:subtilisin-like proprotein convertase family protein
MLSDFWNRWVSKPSVNKPRRSQRRKPCRVQPSLEWLEARDLPTVAPTATPFFVLASSQGNATPLFGSSPSGYTPSQIVQAYGFNQISFSNGPNGTGQTIAIVDAYNAPSIQSDLAAFDTQFGLPAANLRVIGQTGGGAPTATDPTGGWELEESLDVEWAHAVAPGANIVLVEANSASLTDLMTAVQTAANLSGVSAVSMSWGANEFSGETSFDSDFSKAGVAFIGASGDSGAPPIYPAASPNVLAVGGTTLTLDSQNNWLSETGWSGSGGGISSLESQPSYQKGVVTQTTTQRANPDVAYDANPNTGFAVYDSFTGSQVFGGPWYEVGGTSDAAPQWAGLVAIADQGRALNGESTLSSNQLLTALYQMPSSNFHDITSGNNGFSAGPGYDLVTGLGTPLANQVVNSLVTPAPPPAPTAPVITTQPANQTVPAGQTATFTAAASGTPTPTVQWEISTDGGTTWSNISGATSTTLTLTNVTTTMSGNEYEAVFTNSAGSATTNAAILTVTTTAPVITIQPTSQTVTAGANVSFTAAASGNPTPTVQWEVSTDGGTTWNAISGATSTTLTLNNVQTSQSGNEYEAIFTNSTGSATTTAAILTVKPSSGPIVFHSTDTPQPVDFLDVFTTSFINVPQSVTIASLKVQLNITYPLDNDLTIDLIAPDGTDVPLSYFEGTGANFQNTIFDDAATTPIWAGNSPFAGSYQPELPLSSLAGMNAQGTWELLIIDWGASSGTLNSWSLIVQPAGSPTAPLAPAASSLTVSGFPSSTTAGQAGSFVGLDPRSTAFLDDVSLSATPMVAGKNRTAPEASAALAAPVAASGSGNANLAALAIQTGLGSHDQPSALGTNLPHYEVGHLSQPGALAQTFLALQRRAALGSWGDVFTPDWLDPFLSGHLI